MFQLKFLRKFIRRHTKPIMEDSATKWKRRLSVMYMICCWNAFGLVCYQIYAGKADWAKYHGLKTDEELKLSPAQQWSASLGIKKAEVYKVSGLNMTHYKINNEQAETNDVNSESTN